MFLNIFKLAVLKYHWCQVSILNAVISQQGRYQIFREIHMCESLGVLPGDLIIAGPERLLFLVGEAPDPVLQDLCTVRENRQLHTDKGIRVYLHLFGRRDDMMILMTPGPYKTPQPSESHLLSDGLLRCRPPA